MSLDTLANIKLRLGISTSADDTLLGLLQESADRWIANYCGREFEGGNFTEFHPANSPFILLRNYPIAAVSSVRVDPARDFPSSTELATTAYVVHGERGVIQSTSGAFLAPGLFAAWMAGTRAVRVVYTTATAAVPPEVREASAWLVGHWYAQARTQTATGHVNLSRQSVSNATIQFAGSLGEAPGVPPALAQLLANFRTPAL